jgi:mRNA-degrading endonuclease toxin of MazEF toxin-antitoxin module
MAYDRGDVIEIHFNIPGEGLKNHPAIVISNEEVYNIEAIYICVMVTHSDMSSYFAFDLEPEMFLNPKNMPEGKAKAHLIAYVEEKHIIRNIHSKKCKMKKIYVDKLVEFIQSIALTEDDI